MIPQDRYKESKQLYLKSSKKLSFDSFLNWIKVVEELNTRIMQLFNEYTNIPILYMMGEDDKLFLPEVRQTVHNGGKNASLVIVPNAGHVCNVDNKSFFNRQSLNFLCNL